MNEAVFIPKADLANFAGGSGPSGDHTMDVTTLNSQVISDSNWNQLEFSKFGEVMDTPIVVGDLSGDITITAATCGITFPFENSVTRALELYLQCGLSGSGS